MRRLSAVGKPMLKVPFSVATLKSSRSGLHQSDKATFCANGGVVAFS